MTGTYLEAVDSGTRIIRLTPSQLVRQPSLVLLCRLPVARISLFARRQVKQLGGLRLP